MVTAQPDSNTNGLGIRDGMGPNAAWQVTVSAGPSRTDWQSSGHGGNTEGTCQPTAATSRSHCPTRTPRSGCNPRACPILTRDQKRHAQVSRSVEVPLRSARGLRLLYFAAVLRVRGLPRACAAPFCECRVLRSSRPAYGRWAGPGDKDGASSNTCSILGGSGETASETRHVDHQALHSCVVTCGFA